MYLYLTVMKNTAVEVKMRLSKCELAYKLTVVASIVDRLPER